MTNYISKLEFNQTKYTCVFINSFIEKILFKSNEVRFKINTIK